MQLRHRHYFKMWMVFMVALLALTGSVFAQGSETTDPLALSDDLIVLEVSLQPDGPPNYEMLSDGRAIFTISGSGSVSGDLDGVMTTRPNQTVETPPPILDTFAVMFAIETADGRFEGYYTGSFYVSPGAGVATIHGYGQILSVTGVYADLFLAEVFVTGEVPYGPDGHSTGENGTMIISPR